MSHVTSVNLEILDLDAFAQACENLGLQFDRQATTWRWYGRWVRDYNADDAAYKHGIPASRYGTSDAGVVTVPGSAYQIGIYKSPTKPGVYEPVFDFYGGEIEAKLGKRIARLKEEYAAVTTEKTLRRAGWRVNRTKDQQGRLKLLASK